MCGICGLLLDNVAPDAASDWLGRMQAKLCHRGPDERGCFGPLLLSSDPPRTVALGHTRLSILDLECGQQPMASEDGAIRLIANAEIYNFRELRRQLQAAGHQLHTRNDVETIVHLYEEHGDRCFTMLRGMFAIAIWDGRRSELILARDRVGKKPLCYAPSKSGMAFASELSALIECPGIDRTLDPAALDHYLTYQYVPAPMSIYRGIRKLPPGHLLRWRNGEIDVKPYWQLNPGPSEPLPEPEACERIRSILREATELRMVADVPVGAFLSGGIDSSIVVGLMSQIADQPIKTFSIGFEDRQYNELPYARLVAQHFRTEHREFIVKPDALEVLPELIERYGEPFADSSAIPTFYVAKRTREHVKVALNGDGGDESFAGYPRYKAIKLAAAFRFAPHFVRQCIASFARRMPVPAAGKSTLRRARKFLSQLPYSSEDRYLRYVSIFLPEDKALLYSHEFKDRLREVRSQPESLLYEAFSRFGDAELVNRAALADIVTYLPGDLLVKMDTATMANSLEARSPFLDQELIAFAARLPASLKLNGLESKYILKQAFSDLLPPAILRRGKMGFGVPVDRWLRGELNGFLRLTLLKEPATTRRFFNVTRIEEMVEKHSSGRENFADQLWALLMLELWSRRFCV